MHRESVRARPESALPHPTEKRPRPDGSVPDEEVIARSNQRFRVLAVVPFDEEDESPVGLIPVEAA